MGSNILTALVIAANSTIQAFSFNINGMPSRFHIRNEVYVGMSELNFPTKLIRLTKATLTIVTCCVKIQKDCSESFETRQGLRQGDLLSTLLFNVV
jgi:hypothetical protein